MEKMQNEKLYTMHSFRGLAALLVILFHLTEHFEATENFLFLSGFFLFGYCGVDFFFILSGFVIYYAHFNDIANPERFKQYCIKRLIRVYPIYWAIALPIVALYYIYPMRGFQYLDEAYVIPLSLLL